MVRDWSSINIQNANRFSSALTIRREGYTIHVGYDDGSTIIRAIRYDGVLEFIPREVFRDGNSFDLPSNLIDECIHWLYVKSEDAQ